MMAQVRPKLPARHLAVRAVQMTEDAQIGGSAESVVDAEQLCLGPHEKSATVTGTGTETETVDGTAIVPGECSYCGVTCH